MRQLKRSRLQTVYIRPRATEKNDEGVSIDVYGEAFSVLAEIWPATSRRQVELYGDRLTGISNMRIPGWSWFESDGTAMTVILDNGNSIKTGDGVCVYSGSEEGQTPDFRILSITPYQPVLMEIERQ